MIEFEFEIGHLENRKWIPKIPDADERFDIWFSVKNTGSITITSIEPKFVPVVENKEFFVCKFSYRTEYTPVISRLIRPGETYSSFFENVWYNKNIQKIYVPYIDITYINHQSETFFKFSKEAVIRSK